MRLKDSSELIQISGLTALKQILEAYQYSVEEERAPLNMMVDIFFPVLDVLMQNVAQTNSNNQIVLMHLISKIFYSAN